MVSGEGRAVMLAKICYGGYRCCNNGTATATPTSSTATFANFTARPSPELQIQHNIPVQRTVKKTNTGQVCPAEEEEFGLDHLSMFPRLLTSWCWREQGFPAFCPSAPPGNGANGLLQEMLLGFDVGYQPGAVRDHSVLSMIVERRQAADGVGSTWSVTLQASPHPSQVWLG